MYKRTVCLICLVMLMSSIAVTSCNNQAKNNQQQVVQKAPEGPAPDYTAIRQALKDPSPVVRTQALKNLATIKHSSAIEQYIDIAKTVEYDPKTKDHIINGLSAFKEQAIEPIMASLWEEKSPVLQEIAFRVLANVDDKEKVLPMVINKYYATPPTEGNAVLRTALVKYFGNNLDPEDTSQLTDLTLILKDSDPGVVRTAFKALREVKTPLLVEKLTKLYLDNKDNTLILYYANALLAEYPGIDPKNNPVPVGDLTIFLYGFGSYDEKIQNYSHKGLKRFAYNDANGQIMTYLKSFENCDYDLVRSHVFDLVSTIDKNKYPEGKEPKFELPKGYNRPGFCH